MAGGSKRTARSRLKPSSGTDNNNNEDEDPLLINRKPLPKRNTRNHNNLLRITSFNLKTTLAFCIISILVITSTIYFLMNPIEEKLQKLRVVTPFPAPKLMDLPQFQGEHKESLYWGTYRPQVYFGVRARTPESLIAGLMWIGVKDGRYSIRHVCQDSDELGTYGWTRHNGRDYGEQVIVDQDVTLTTSFVKSKGSGSGYGGDWAARIDVQKEKLDDEVLGAGHYFLYLADEAGSSLRIDRDRLDTREGTLFASGTHKDVGGWEFHLASEDNLDIHFAGFNTPHMHNLTELVEGALGAHARRVGRLEFPDILDQSPNVLVFQVSAKFPFKMDLAFVSGTDQKSPRVEERVKSLTGNSLGGLLIEKQKDFEQQYNRCFNLSDKVDSESMNVGRAAIGNMLGGIGYYYGQSKIALPRDSDPTIVDNFVPYWPAELYTAVPSRPVFPRGFLWDEGFHQLLIWRWDIRICLDILGHWLDLMNIDGWIPREQILGSEALSKVPQEYVAQYPTNANPPALFLVLGDLVRSTKRNEFSAAEREEISSFLDRAFVRLEAWFQWFNTTQSGKYTSSYYWHGRDKETTGELNPMTLSSGFDDYPRASHPTEDERHVDLRCWMQLAADSMHTISDFLNRNDKEYKSMADLLSNIELLNQLHFDEVSGAYFDFGNHTEKVRLRWKEMMTPSGAYAGRQLVREVLDTPKLGLVPHIGYVSFFPLIMKIIPSDSWILEKQLDLIHNRSILWTDYGLRSLAKTSSLYMKRNKEHDLPYWRGPIWMNMNYLILSAIHHYSIEDGPYQEKARTIYEELRTNIIRNVVKNYKKTGYIWEQYDATDKGKGKRAHPFTGWTALVLLIMSESYSQV
ncbi:mannosyl-oligosaccharide glucosidase [Ranunculus cassubicifolius]